MAKLQNDACNKVGVCECPLKKDIFLGHKRWFECVPQNICGGHFTPSATGMGGGTFDGLGHERSSADRTQQHLSPKALSPALSPSIMK